MVFNLEPYAGVPGVGGFRLENDHIVTKDGVDIYTTYPFDERLVIDVHPLDATTGRTRRGSQRNGLRGRRGGHRPLVSA